MSTVDGWWAVAGGWAIDLWIDTETREHHDVEVVVPRNDQHRVRAALVDDGWELFCLDPPGTGWRAWTGHQLEWPAFQIQARNQFAEFDLFLEDVDDGIWHYRRDHNRTLPANRVIVVSTSNIPVVRPEVQLLYMATSTDPKNTADFAMAAPRLDNQAREWLRAELRACHPGHQWIGEL